MNDEQFEKITSALVELIERPSSKHAPEFEVAIKKIVQNDETSYTTSIEGSCGFPDEKTARNAFLLCNWIIELYEGTDGGFEE